VANNAAAHDPGQEDSGRSYLWIVAFTVPAILGYAIYGLHPERLAGSELAMRFYPMSFQLFAQLHILVSAAVLFAVLFRRLRLSWLPALGAVALISFTAEHVGTGYGVPFGGYGYTGLLGFKVGGRVPALIPLSWFLMALPAWVMTRAAFPAAAQRGARIALGAAWLVAWDLALDPAMSYLTAYWRWEESGPYYGMPWLNLLGWFTTGVLLMGALEAVATRVRLERVGARWSLGYYLAVLTMPLGMLLAAGEWLAIGVTAAGVGSLVAVTEWARASRPLTFNAPSTVEAVEA
jgi:putative membrane protein